MSLALLITINFLAGVALLAALTYALSRAGRLTPHVAAQDTQPITPGTPAPPTAQRHARVNTHGRASVRTSAATAARA
jgi:hypothetical protein